MNPAKKNILVKTNNPTKTIHVKSMAENFNPEITLILFVLSISILYLLFMSIFEDIPALNDKRTALFFGLYISINELIRTLK